MKTNGFEEFWRNYPRKLAKKNAQKAWNALKADDLTAERVFSVLAERKSRDWRGRKLSFIPYPATFLRAEDFSGRDEVEALQDDPVFPEGWREKDVEFQKALAEVRRLEKKELK